MWLMIFFFLHIQNKQCNKLAFSEKYEQYLTSDSLVLFSFTEDKEYIPGSTNILPVYMCCTTICVYNSA